jgi:hypothetical protein
VDDQGRCWIVASCHSGPWREPDPSRGSRPVARRPTPSTRGRRDRLRGGINHELTQSEFAQLVGSTRESVNKALANFVTRAWIRRQGETIFIYDSEALARRAK